MSDQDYYPRSFPREGRFPPRRKPPPWPPGENFEALTEKHGKPHGPFDEGRVLPYRAKEDNR